MWGAVELYLSVSRLYSVSTRTRNKDRPLSLQIWSLKITQDICGVANSDR